MSTLGNRNGAETELDLGVKAHCDLSSHILTQRFRPVFCYQFCIVEAGNHSLSLPPTAATRANEATRCELMKLFKYIRCPRRIPAPFRHAGLCVTV